MAGEPVTTTMGSQLAVKVEGIIQVTTNHRSFNGRRIQAVQVTVLSTSATAAVGPEGKVYYTTACWCFSLKPLICLP